MDEKRTEADFNFAKSLYLKLEKYKDQTSPTNDKESGILQLDSVYRHTTHNNFYIPRDYCRMKNPDDGEWFDGVIYEALDDDGVNELYCRSLKSFQDNFEFAFSKEMI